MKKILSLIVWYLLFLCKRRYSKKPSVGLVVYSFDKGGLEQIVLNLYKGYRKKGIDAYIIVQSDIVGDFVKELDSISHLRIVNNNHSDFYKFCYEKSINTLHYHSNTFLLKTSKLLGFKVIYTIHNTYVWFNNESWTKYSDSVKYCDNIIASTEWNRKFFKKKSKLNQVGLINYGIDLSNLDHGHKYNDRLIKKFCSANDKVFVHLASVNEAKHQILLIGAMEAVLKKRNDIKILVAGHILNPVYYNLFYEELKKSPARSNILYIGRIDQDELGDFLRKIPIAALLPSLYEGGLTLSMMECIYCDVPVIATNFCSPDSSYNNRAIYPIKPAYDNIFNVTYEEILSLARCKNTSNVLELADTIIRLADNQQVTADNMIDFKNTFRSNLFSVDVMVKKYSKLIK